MYRTANRELLETVEMTKRNAERNPKKPQSGLTAQEQISIDKYLARKAASTAPRVKLNWEKEVPQISAAHSDQSIGFALLMDALGTADIDFLDGSPSTIGSCQHSGEPNRGA